MSSPYEFGSIGGAYHRQRTWMDSAGRLCAFDIGGPQPMNGHLYNLVGASPAWTRSPTHHPDAVGSFFSSWATITYTKCLLQRPKLFRQQDDNEGIRLRRRGLVGTNHRIPAVCAHAFGSFVRHRVAEIRCRKIVGLLGRHTSSGR